MPKKLKQHQEVYEAVTSSGKSLLQLYVEMRDDRDKLAAALAKSRIGIS
jgi:glutaredoxin-related protein